MTLATTMIRMIHQARPLALADGDAVTAVGGSVVAENLVVAGTHCTAPA